MHGHAINLRLAGCHDKAYTRRGSSYTDKTAHVNLCALCSMLRGKASYGAVDPPCFR